VKNGPAPARGQPHEKGPAPRHVSGNCQSFFAPKKSGAKNWQQQYIYQQRSQIGIQRQQWIAWQLIIVFAVRDKNNMQNQS
jgi:hypothetical protein